MDPRDPVVPYPEEQPDPMPESGEELPRTVDAEKAEAAAIYYERYVAAREHPTYLRMKEEHLERYEREG